jgi:hypothetical protein
VPQILAAEHSARQIGAADVDDERGNSARIGVEQDREQADGERRRDEQRGEAVGVDGHRIRRPEPDGERPIAVPTTFAVYGEARQEPLLVDPDSKTCSGWAIRPQHHRRAFESPKQQRANSRASVRDNIQPATSTISSCSNS